MVNEHDKSLKLLFPTCKAHFTSNKANPGRNKVVTEQEESSSKACMLLNEINIPRFWTHRRRAARKQVTSTIYYRIPKRAA